MNGTLTPVHIINPAAGGGEAQSLFSAHGEKKYVTSSVNDAYEYTRSLCESTPRVHIFVYGGDGTLNEVVNGIMAAGANEYAAVTVVAAGTGNDFVRCFTKGESRRCDIAKYNDKYYVNMLNVGFDCDVVKKTGELKKKPLISGEFAYALGVALCLAGKFGKELEIELTLPDGTRESYNGEFLLCAAANGAYYGGGFKAAPASSPEDGLLDILLVRKLSRIKFISIVGDYKKGLHIDPETLRVSKRFADIMTYRKCSEIIIRKAKNICIDGEIEQSSEAVVSVVPRAINFIF